MEIDPEEIKEKVESARAYYMALGRFVHKFSEVESSLKSFLARLLGIDAHTANAVFSGMRTKPAMDAIRRVYERNNQTPDALYASITEQLGQILSARDWIIHFGARLYEQSEPMVTNARYAHTTKAVREFPISHLLLDDMTADLEVIESQITLAEIRMWMEASEFKKSFGNVEPPTWRYKHAPQPRRRAKSPPKDQTP